MSRPPPKYSVRCTTIVPFSPTFHLSELQDVLSQFDEKDPTAARPTIREKARELCSEHMAGWASCGSGSLKNLRIGIPQVRSRFASLSPFDLLTSSKYTGILSGFARQFNPPSFPPHRSNPQGSRRDRAPRLPPKHQPRLERVLCHRQRRGEQQPRAL